MRRGSGQGQEVLTGDFHQWVEIPGTEEIYCDKDGATYRDVELECTYCGETKTLEHVKISDYHMFGEWQVVNKVYRDGVEIGSLYVRRCSVCGLNEQKYFVHHLQ